MYKQMSLHVILYNIKAYLINSFDFMVEGLPLEFTFNKQLSQVLPVHTNGACTSHLIRNRNMRNMICNYRSGTVNSKSFIGKVLLRIKWKF